MRAFPFAAIAVGVPVAAHTVPIAAMAWRAAARVDGTVERWVGLAGGVLFLLSDSLLAADRFVAPLRSADLWVLSTYWGAQALIARSATGGLGKRPASGSSDSVLRD